MTWLDCLSVQFIFYGIEVIDLYYWVVFVYEGKIVCWDVSFKSWRLHFLNNCIVCDPPCANGVCEEKNHVIAWLELSVRDNGIALVFLTSSQCLLVFFYVRNSMIRYTIVPTYKNFDRFCRIGLIYVVLLHKLSYWLVNLYHIYLFSTTTLIEVISFLT